MITEELKLTGDFIHYQITESVETISDKDQLPLNNYEAMEELITDTPLIEDKVLREINTIRMLLEEGLNKFNSRDKSFEKLYDELDDLKRNKAFEDNRSMFLDLILLIDRVNTATTDISDDYTDILNSIQEELIEILERKDVRVIKENFKEFDPRFQKAIKTEMVDDESFDNTIIGVLRPGYKFREIVLRYQEVIVGRYPHKY